MSPRTASFSFSFFLADHKAGRVLLVQFPECLTFMKFTVRLFLEKSREN
jgi:hypothetical protein